MAGFGNAGLPTRMLNDAEATLVKYSYIHRKYSHSQVLIHP